MVGFMIGSTIRRIPTRWLARVALAVGVTSVSIQARPARAQDQQDFQVWAALLATADTQLAPPGLAFWLDVHARRGDTGTVHILRPGLGVHLLPFLSVWAGYAWVPVFSDQTGAAVHEHRVWEQIILQHRLPFGLALQSRTRLEQRFSEAGSGTGLRLRQFLRAGWQPWEHVPIGAVVWDELFVGLNETTWTAPRGLDQNRLFAGLSLATAPFARLEAGYLFLYVDRRSDLFGHVLAVNLFVSFRPDPED